jgi:hypothetical protein
LYCFVLLLCRRSDGARRNDCPGRVNLVSLGVATGSLGARCRLRLSAGARIRSGAVSIGSDGLGNCGRRDYRGGGRSFVVVVRINFRLGPAWSRRDAREAETEHDDRNAGKLPCVHVLFTLGRDSMRVLTRNWPAHCFYWEMRKLPPNRLKKIAAA